MFLPVKHEALTHAFQHAKKKGGGGGGREDQLRMFLSQSV